MPRGRWKTEFFRWLTDQGISMRVLIGALAVAMLAGCADSGPMKVGPDTYTISTRVPFGGPASAKGQALKEANTFLRIPGTGNSPRPYAGE